MPTYGRRFKERSLLPSREADALDTFDTTVKAHHGGMLFESDFCSFRCEVGNGLGHGAPNAEGQFIEPRGKLFVAQRPIGPRSGQLELEALYEGTPGVFLLPC